MARKQITILVEESDLAELHLAAGRLGISEAELIRQAIQLSVLAHRNWGTPVFSEVNNSVFDRDGASYENVADDTWVTQAAEYHNRYQV